MVFLGCFFVLCVANSALAHLDNIIGTEFVYEFGNYDYRSVLVHMANGRIPILTRETSIVLPVPFNIKITNIILTVKALASPKVAYDSPTRTITIKYNLLQPSGSSYNIEVHGIKFYRSYQ